jgi:AGZA family xanthine/uracil permease-like MFS transporter
MARRLPGALLWGILASAVIGVPFGIVRYQGLASAPPSIAPTFLQLDVWGALTPGMMTVMFVFFLLALFDSVGTLVAVGEQAGFMRQGSLPRARQALLADALGTVAGAMLGTSTVTAYVESTAGVAVGGRTGLASLVTSALFILSLFLYPLVRTIGGGFPAGTTTLYPVVAAPLILVGTMMMGGLRHIAWDDPTEAIPAFLTVIMMPLAVSITEGVAFGVIAHVILKGTSGRGGGVHPLLYVFATLFLVRYAFLR